MKLIRIISFSLLLAAASHVQAKTISKDPLYILDGKSISKAEMNKIDQSKIASVNVLKGKAAKEKYGKKGKQGVIEITSKK